MWWSPSCITVSQPECPHSLQKYIGRPRGSEFKGTSSRQKNAGLADTSRIRRRISRTHSCTCRVRNGRSWPLPSTRACAMSARKDDSTCRCSSSASSMKSGSHSRTSRRRFSRERMRSRVILSRISRKPCDFSASDRPTGVRPASPNHAPATLLMYIS